MSTEKKHAETDSRSHSRKDDDAEEVDAEEVDVEVDVSEDESEYEEIDLTENPLYQVLSAFFENEQGENLCDHIAKLTLAVENSTKVMEKLMKQKK